MLTPKIAEELMTTSNYPGQRSLRNHHVAYLASEIGKGNFRHSDIRIAVLEGKSYVVNGQHRCWAVIEAGVSIPVTLTTVQVHSKEDLALEYADIDNNLARTLSDAIGAAELGTELGVSNGDINQLGGAVALIINGFTSIGGNHRVAARSRHTRFDVIRFFGHEIAQFCELISPNHNRTRRRLMRAGIGSVALATLREQPNTAPDFWQAVAHGEMLAKGDPRHTLRQYIFNVDGQTHTAATASRRAASAWNAWSAGRKLHVLQSPRADGPINIAGTCYDGKRVVTFDELKKECAQ